MYVKEELFLKTKLSQLDVTKILINNLKKTIEYFTYNIRRYKVPVCLVLIYTEEDISQKIKESIRLTDVFIPVKIGESYFNFMFLPFTDEKDSYACVKNIQYTHLINTKSFFYHEQLGSSIINYNNLINTFLYEIKKEETFF